MRKVIYLFCLALLILPAISALNLDVKTNSTNVIMIRDINQPAVFNLQINNLGASESVKFYNLQGFNMAPTGAILLTSGQATDIPLVIYPRSDSNYGGYYALNYVIQGSSGASQQESVTFKVIDLPDAFVVGASEINPESNSVTIYIRNMVNFNFQNINAEFNSPFFKLDRQFSLAPYEQKQFVVTLNKDDFKSLLAGFYTLSTNVQVGNKTTTIEGDISFSEQNILKQL